MKLSAARAEIAEAVKWASGAVSPNPSHPALGGLSLTATKDALRIVGHDFDQVHTVTIPAEVDEPGTLFPVAAMTNVLLGALKGDRVALAADKAGMSIKAGRSAYTVSTFNAKDWHDFPTESLEVRGTVDADELRRCLGLAGATSDDENAVVRLRGVRLEADGDELAVVGLQSSRCGAGYAKWAGSTFDARVSARNLTAAVRALSGAVTVSTSDAALSLADATHSVTLRQYAIGEDYPQWRQLLVPGSQVVEVEAELFRDAVRRAALATGPKGVAIATAIGDGVIRVSGAGDDAKGEELVDCTGDGAHSASWTRDVLLSVLSTLPSTEVTLSFGAGAGGKVPGANPPMLISDKARSFDAVIMPRLAGR